MTSSKQLSPNGFSEAAAFLKALADPVRLQIIDLLRKEELSVGEIVNVLDLPQPTVSRHLSYLYQRHLVERRKEANQVFYSVKSRRITRLCESVCDCLLETHKSTSDLFVKT